MNLIPNDSSQCTKTVTSESGCTQNHPLKLSELKSSEFMASAQRVIGIEENPDLTGDRDQGYEGVGWCRRADPSRPGCAGSLDRQMTKKRWWQTAQTDCCSLRADCIVSVHSLGDKRKLHLSFTFHVFLTDNKAIG